MHLPGCRKNHREGIAFAGRWFDDLPSRNDNQVEFESGFGKIKASIQVEEKQINI